MRSAAPVVLCLCLAAGAALLQVAPASSADNADSLAAAQSALLRAAQTSDPRDAAAAHQQVQRAFEANPRDPRSWTLRAWEAMSAHRFGAALDYVEQAHALGPPTIVSLGLQSDALVELGRYEEALACVQRMLDLDPALPALSRAAHLRFLHGDTEGALDLLRGSPVLARAPPAERGQILLQSADLRLMLGQADAAQAAAEEAGQLLLGRPETAAVRARIAASRGRHAQALALYLAAQARRPSPEYALGAWRAARDSGNRAAQLRQQRLLDGMSRLDEAQGGLYRRVFIEYHGSDPQRLREAQRLAQLDLHARPDIYAHAWMAWTLRGPGEAGRAASHAAQALRLGTRDPKLQALAGSPTLAAQR
jgi:tetratricopeptide (TPR) repeat protein